MSGSRRLAGALLIALLVGPASAQPLPPASETPRFPPLAGTLAGLSLEMAYEAAREREDSPCADPEQGSWPCAMDLLASLAHLERSLADSGFARNPALPRMEAARRHGGRDWDYWWRFARLCDAARALGRPDWLSPAAHALRRRMEDEIDALLADWEARHKLAPGP